jgi:hypothetical protein
MAQNEVNSKPSAKFCIISGQRSLPICTTQLNWLSGRGIPFTDRMCKPELYSLIKLRKPRFKTFKIDALLAEHGHSTLRLPPYHPDLNPIELV